MNRDIFVTIVIALGLFIFVAYRFFGINPIEYLTGYGSEITVYVKEGSYYPAVIQVNANEPLHIRFIRQDLSACAKVLVFPTFNLTYDLPMNVPVEVNLPPLAPGEYVFNCGISLIQGKIVAQ